MHGAHYLPQSSFITLKDSYIHSRIPLVRTSSELAIHCSVNTGRATNKQTNVFVKPRTSPFTGGHSSHALRLGPLGGARRTQMRSSALGVLPQCPRGLMLDCARHTSHCESNFGSFCRGCPTQRSRVPSSVSWVDSSRLRSCSVAASRLGFYLVSPPSSRLGSGPRLVASSRVGLAGGSWWLAVAGWCLAVSLGGSGRLAVTRDGS